MACLIKHEETRIWDYPDEKKKAAYISAAMRLIGTADEEMSAPLATRDITNLHREIFGFFPDMTELKRRYNHRMLEMWDEIEGAVLSAPDPLLAALKYARAGNYIDFGAMDDVDDQTLARILRNAQAGDVDEAEYRAFCADLDRAKHFLLVADNAGEIVLDKLFLKVLGETHPQLSRTVLVRGLPTSNDATPQDAAEIGLSDVARVIGNGTDIAGTEMRFISEEARKALEEADVILAKGQGNFETLNGCGLNVYYIFLNKCAWFVKRFATERFAGMFVSERRMPSMKYL